MNISLIGMSASGKTYVGKKLANALTLTLIDPDKHIEQKYSLSLQQVLEKLGDQAFLEEEVAVTNALTQGDGLLISTGGSAVYSTALMEHLQERTRIIYLEVPFSTIKDRIDGIPRGIVGFPERTLAEIYEERVPLYEKYADITVDATRDADSICTDVLKRLMK